MSSQDNELFNRAGRKRLQKYKERIFSLVQLREVNWPRKHANPANCRPIELLGRDGVHIQCHSVYAMATIRGISCFVLILSSAVYANDGVPKEIGKISIFIDISSRYKNSSLLLRIHIGLSRPDRPISMY